MTPMARSSRGSQVAHRSLAEGQAENAPADVVEEGLVAPGKGRTDALRSAGASQFERRRDGAAVGREADQDRVAAVLLAHELADIPFALYAHMGRPGVAEVRVMRPDDDLRGRAAARQEATSSSSVSAMWRSRRFHEETSPRYIVR